MISVYYCQAARNALNIKPVPIQLLHNVYFQKIVHQNTVNVPRIILDVFLSVFSEFAFRSLIVSHLLWFAYG